MEDCLLKAKLLHVFFFIKLRDTSHMFKETNNSDYKLFLHERFL